MKLRKLVQILFVISFVFISSLFGARILIKGAKDINYLENRGAYQVPKFSLDNFFDGTYQNDLESAVNDQLWGSERLKKTNLKYNNFIGSKLLIPFRSDSYYLVVSNLYGYDNSDYLLYKPYDEEYLQSQLNAIVKQAKKYEKVLLSDKYLYFINTDRSLNFKEGIDNSFYEFIIKYYSSYNADYFKVNSFEEYKNYFYKTDHHWNYKGSYQGYKDIIKLMLGDEELVLEPVEEVEFKYTTYGSKANNSQFFDYKEKFTAYKFELPNFETYINGKKKDYGNQKLLFANPDLYDEDYNLKYGDFYGYDYAEVIYDFNQPDKENLLLIGYSDTNAINELVASHFDKTYVVDIRHFDDFRINDYVKENDIDKLLVILNPQSIGRAEDFERLLVID